MLKKMFRNYDYSLVVSVLLLCGFGVLMVYSASIGAYVLVSNQSEFDTFFIRQIFSLCVALIGFTIAMLFPYKAYQKVVKLIVFGAIALLGYVLISGRVASGAESWINLGGFGFQPSELVKLGIIMYLASVFSNKQHYISNFSRGVMPPLTVIFLLIMLVAMQPDYGTAAIIAGIAAVMIVCSGMQFKHWFSLFVLTASSIGILFWMRISKEQLSRFAAYNPFADPGGDGLQLIQSYLAIASGGLTGRGLGESIQKLGYLPEAYTDFIMAVVAEELGLFGVIFVIGLLAYIVFRGFLIGIRCKDTFGSLLAIGIASFVGIQSVINLGVVTGLLPTTGIPLPFISYGGSSLVVLMFSMGILINISMFVNVKRKKSVQETIQQPQLSINQRM